MELRTLLLGGGHQWDGNPPATEEDVAALVAASPVPLPAAYLALLRLSDGGSASLSNYPGDVRIWSARTAVDYNDGYEVQRWHPGFIAFGDNEGPDMVGFDIRKGEPYPVCAVSFAPMEWSAALGTVPDFMAFIRQLLPVDVTQPELAATADGGA